MDVKKREISGWCKPAAGAFMTMALVTAVYLVWSFPLVLSPSNSLIGHPGDSLSTLDRWEYWRPAFRFVERPLVNLAGRALSGIMGPVLAYNLLVASSFPLSGMAAFLLCYRVSGHVAASIVGGAIYALSPIHWAHSLGHLYEATIQWLPLWGLAILSFAAVPSIARGCAVIGASLLLLGSSYYYGYFAAVVLVPLAFVWLLMAVARGVHIARILRVLAVAMGVLILTLPITHSYLRWLMGGTAMPGDLHDLFRYSARPNEYLLPGAFSALRRMWSPVTLPGSLHLSNEVEQSLFLGWGPLALAVLGCVALVWGPQRREWRRGELTSIVGAGLLAAVCSAPPFIRVGSTVVAMPAGFLFKLVPFFRTYARMGVIVHLAVSCAAAMGAAQLVSGRRSSLIAGGLILIVIVEFTPVPPPRVLRLFPIRGAHAWVAARQDGQLLAEFPFDSRATPHTTVRDYATSLHGGYSIEEAVGVDIRHVRLLDVGTLRDLFPRGEGLVLLHDRNPDPPLQIYKDRPDRGLNLPGAWPAISAAGLRLLAHFPESSVLTTGTSRHAVSLARGGGLGAWAEGSRNGGRPIMAPPCLVLLSDARRPLVVDLNLVILPAEDIGGLAVVVNERRVGAYSRKDTMQFELQSLEVLPGENELLIQPLDEHGVPIATAGNVGMLSSARITAEGS